MSYDYNRPCCGKDQCDCESAATKSISDVSLILSFTRWRQSWKALCYGYEMKDCNITLIQVVPANTVITGDKTSSIFNYHSIQFQNNYIMWLYIDTRVGFNRNAVPL